MKQSVPSSNYDLLSPSASSVCLRNLVHAGIISAGGSCTIGRWCVLSVRSAATGVGVEVVGHLSVKFIRRLRLSTTTTSACSSSSTSSSGFASTCCVLGLGCWLRCSRLGLSAFVSHWTRQLDISRYSRHTLSESLRVSLCRASRVQYEFDLCDSQKMMDNVLFNNVAVLSLVYHRPQDHCISSRLCWRYQAC